MLRKILYCILVSSLTTFLLLAAGFNLFDIPIFYQERSEVPLWGRICIGIILFTNWYAIYMVSLLVTWTYHQAHL